MAHKRMFSKDITGSDAFRDMPTSSQSLYFHLGMEADDDGFLGNYKSLMRAVGCSDDDLKILVSKRFLMVMKDGVVVVKHWRINNTIRKDRYIPTKYLESKNGLYLKENGAYTDDKESGCRLVDNPATQYRIGEDSIEKSSAKISSSSKEKLDDDISIDPTIDPETGEPLKKFGKRIDGKKEPKYVATANETVQRIVKGFQKMCKRELGTSPIANIGWYKQTNRAITTGGLTEKDIKKMLTEWFTQRLPEGEMCSLTRALSDIQINKFKVENNI